MNEENRAIFGLPLVRFAPFLAVGMIAAYYGGSLVSAIVIGGSAVAFALSVKAKKPFMTSFLGLLCGALIMLGFVKLRVEPVLAYSERTVRAEIVVDEIIADSSDNQQITARLRLDGVSTKAELFCTEHLKEGQRAFAEITFFERDAEWETYNIAKGTPLSGSAEILSVGEITPVCGAVRAIRWLRGLFAGRVREFIAGETGELTLSLLFGMDEQLSTIVYEKLRICGAVHFTAVSGTHFSLLAAILLGLIPRQHRRERAVVSLLFTPIAVVFFGASSSVIRASAMFLINSATVLFLRESETLNTLCAAVTAVCLISPASAIDLGFQMSVLGVFGAGVVGVKSTERLCSILSVKYQRFGAAIRLIFVSAGAVICIAPLSAVFFKGISAVGVLTSILMIPLITLGFIFAIALGITGFGLLSVPLAAVMKIALMIVDFLGSFRGLWITTDFIGAWLVLALLAAMAVIIAMGNPRWVITSVNCAAVLTLFLLSGTLIFNSRRCETVIVDSTRGSAEISVSGNTASINITKSSGSFSKTLLQSLRENGARSLSEITVSDEEYSAALITADLLDAFNKQQ